MDRYRAKYKTTARGRQRTIPVDPEKMAYKLRSREGIPIDKEAHYSLEMITNETGSELKVRD